MKEKCTCAIEPEKAPVSVSWASDRGGSCLVRFWITWWFWTGKHSWSQVIVWPKWMKPAKKSITAKGVTWSNKQATQKEGLLNDLRRCWKELAGHVEQLILMTDCENKTNRERLQFIDRGCNPRGELVKPFSTGQTLHEPLSMLMMLSGPIIKTQPWHQPLISDHPEVRNLSPLSLYQFAQSFFLIWKNDMSLFQSESCNPLSSSRFVSSFVSNWAFWILNILFLSFSLSLFLSLVISVFCFFFCSSW